MCMLIKGVVTCNDISEAKSPCIGKSSIKMGTKIQQAAERGLLYRMVFNGKMDSRMAVWHYWGVS